MKEKIALGCDHAGFELKQEIRKFLDGIGVEALDRGTHGRKSVDYPDYGARVASMVSTGEVGRGILVCGSGIGMSIVANKFPGVRAALIDSIHMARMCRKHNDANVLVLAGRVTAAPLAREIVQAWLETAFDGGRHAARLAKIATIEEDPDGRGA